MNQRNDLVLTINLLDDENITESQKGKWFVCRIYEHGPVPFGPLFDTTDDMLKFISQRVKEIWPR